jgi:hypothetical protein
MRNQLEAMTLRRAALGALIACLLVFQGALAGFAHASTGGRGSLLSEICASTSNRSSDDSSKLAPHHGGACCILQHNILAEPNRDGGATVVAPARVARTSALSPAYRTRIVADAPEMASAVPRGPPSLAA